MKSRGFYLRLCDLVCNVVVLGWGNIGVGVLLQDLLQSMVVESLSVVSIFVVRILCPYSWVRDVVRVL